MFGIKKTFFLTLFLAEPKYRFPEIKLVRTDTTLDLSQKAEKVCLELGALSDLKTQTQSFCSGCDGAGLQNTKTW